MKACVLHKKGDLRYEEVPDPCIKDPNEVVVRMLAGGICGSDQHYFKEGCIGTAIVVREPFILGHEGCGIIEETGPEVSGLHKGDMVVIRPARPCFHCKWCAKGMYTYCMHVTHLGSASTMPHTPGLFADKVVVHEAQCRVVHNMSPEVGAFAEPMAVAWNGVHQAGDIIGKDVLVMGAGPIGCLCTAAAKAAGAGHVTVIDIRNEPLELARRMSADEVCNSQTQPELIAQWAKDKGRFDIMLEASGFGAACEQGMQLVHPEGTVSQVGMFGINNQPKDFGAFSVKGLRWNSVFRFYDEFEPAVAALESGRINPLPLLSDSFNDCDCVEAMQAAMSPATSKVQLRFNEFRK